MKKIIISTLLLLIAIVLQAQNITYDALGRVTSIVYNGTTTVTYTYDAVGNRTSETVLSLVNTDVTFAASDICQGSDELLVPIIVNNVSSSFGAVSLTFAYDTTLLDYHSIASSHPSLNLSVGSNFYINEVNDQLFMAWASTAAATLQDGDTLMVLKFTPDNGTFNTATTTAFAWDTIPGNNELSDGSMNILPATFVDSTATILALPNVTFTNDATNDSICAGDTILFTASGGLTYEFFINGTSQGAADTINTFSIATLTDQDTVSVEITNSSGCSVTESDTITVLPLPTIGITANDTTICIGDAVTFTATGGINYEFFINNVSQGAASTTATFDNSTLANGDVVKVVGTNANGCSDTSSVITMIVNDLPTIGITANDTTICIGDAVTFTATGAVDYEFFINNISQGAASTTATFDNSTLVNGDVVKVVGTNANGCIDTSSVITMIVNDLPTIGITATDTTICVGDAVTFTATGAVDYEFFINNVSQGAASTTATFTSSTLSNGDILKVVGTNANGCIDTSSVITMVVNPLPEPTMTIDAEGQVCLGSTVVFTAAGADEYIFQVDGVTAQAQSSNNIYNHTANTDGVVITVIGVNVTTGCQQLSGSTFTLEVDPCYSVEGMIRYNNTAKTPMGNVTVTIQNINDAQDTQVTVTDTVGAAFVFNNLLDLETFTFEYATTKTHGGINATDALEVLLYAVGTQGLTEIEEKAADVDSTNSINAADALLIMKRFVQQINTFNAGDWAFEDRTYAINGSSFLNDTIFALAMGDVNGSYTPNITENNSVFLNNNGILEITNGQSIQIPVRITDANKIGAMSLAFYVPSAGLNITNVTLGNGQNVMYTVQGDELRLAWADLTPMFLGANDVVFFIDAMVTDALSFSATPIAVLNESEIANELALPYGYIVLEMPMLQQTATNVTSIATEGQIALRNYPNPFTNSTIIEYDLPMAADVQLIVRDALGSVIKTLVNTTQLSGKHQVQMTVDGMPTGIYFYTLTITTDAGVKTITKRMMIAK